MLKILDAVCHAAALADDNRDGIHEVGISEALRRNGLPKISRSEIRKQIQRFRKSSGPEALARSFVDSLRPADGEADVPLLNFYRGEFYRFNGRVWAKIPDIEPPLVQYLQTAPLQTPVTARLVGDVQKNLKGIGNVFGSADDTPLWLEEGGNVKKSPYIACGNGLLDLSPVLEGQPAPRHEPFTPRHFSTLQLGFDFYEDASCPLWRKTLDQILPRDNQGDLRKAVLQEFFGYCLFGNALRLEMMLILFGTGANGKSVLLHVLRAMLGEANVSGLRFEDFGDSHQLAPLEGKLAIITTEMDRADRADEGVIKKIVSQEQIQLNPKYRQPYSTVLKAKLIVATNVLPAVSDRTDALYRRLIVVPCEQKFVNEQADVELINKLLHELPGIANWALQGASRLAKNKRFSQCAVCRKWLDKLKLHSDPMRQFVDERCVRDENAKVTCAKMYGAYCAWCKHNNRNALSSSNFWSQFIALTDATLYRPGVKGSTQRPRCCRGVKLRYA